MQRDTTTTVLNFHRYDPSRYDRDIVLAVPGHTRLHDKIQEIVARSWTEKRGIRVLDLGCGTGLTAKAVRDVMPNATITVMDFSDDMVRAAKDRLGETGITCRVGDYTKDDLGPGKYDLVTCAIGLHHQTDAMKVVMFRRIKEVLNTQKGIFLFADLMTFSNPLKAAERAARHYHHLVEMLPAGSLGDWAHHHMYLNKLASVEDQLQWLRAMGFDSLELSFEEVQTVLITAIP